MPARRGSARGRIEDALSALARALEASGAPWMVIGGIAVIAHGVRRLTTDIDAVVRGDAVEVPALLELLAQHEIVSRIEDPLRFAEQNLVLLLRHPPSGVDLDVSLAWSAFENEALCARKTTRFGSTRAPMATPEALVVFKAIAARPKDLQDVEALLALHPEIDIAHVRAYVRQHRLDIAEPIAVETDPHHVAGTPVPDLLHRSASGWYTDCSESPLGISL